jgi:hypothetical protein
VTAAQASIDQAILNMGSHVTAVKYLSYPIWVRRHAGSGLKPATGMLVGYMCSGRRKYVSISSTFTSPPVSLGYLPTHLGKPGGEVTLHL